MNEADEIVEWYFDMTKENGLDNGKPFFWDLYLDIAVSSDRMIKILDEDELIEALKLGVITHDDYELANRTCKDLIESVIPNEAFMTDFFYEQLERFTNRMI
jgi:predicted RNA-binding protein associated with RNAse of E/G family